MSSSYSQFQAMLAITRASLRAILRSPSTIMFSLFFPLIFILVFGFIGNSGGPMHRLFLDPKSDTSNLLYNQLKGFKNIRFVNYETEQELNSDLTKGRITGILFIQKKQVPDSLSDYEVLFRATSASADKYATFLPLLENTINKIDRVTFRGRRSVAQIKTAIQSVREYRTIDFILPGQLGFSLLSAGIFGVAFLSFNLRQQLVLKRFYATPIRRGYIVLGEGLSRVIFQLMTAVVIIAIGYFLFHFTLINGWLTFLEIMILCFIALLVFMGFGFIISGLAKMKA